MYLNRPAFLAFLAVSFLSACTETPPDGPAADAPSQFPTVDAQAPIKKKGTSVGDILTRNDATPTDASVIPDTGPLSDTQPTDAASPDTSLPPQDTSPQEDTNPPSAPDTGGPTGPCKPAGTWALAISSAAQPGQGCGEDGAPAQNDTTQEFIIKAWPGGGYSVIMVGADDPVPAITAQASGTQDSCKIKLQVNVSVNVPGAGDIEGGTAGLLYEHQAEEKGGVVQGTGAVTTSFVTNSGEVIAKCTEPLTIQGTFAPQ